MHKMVAIRRDSKEMHKAEVLPTGYYIGFDPVEQVMVTDTKEKARDT